MCWVMVSSATGGMTGLVVEAMDVKEEHPEMYCARRGCTGEGKDSDIGCCRKKAKRFRHGLIGLGSDLDRIRIFLQGLSPRPTITAGRAQYGGSSTNDMWKDPMLILYGTQVV